MNPLRIFLLLALLVLPFGGSEGPAKTYSGAGDQALQLWGSADTPGLVAAAVVGGESARLPRKDADQFGIVSFGQLSATIHYHGVAPAAGPGMSGSVWRVAYAPRAPPAPCVCLIS